MPISKADMHRFHALYVWGMRVFARGDWVSFETSTSEAYEFFLGSEFCALMLLSPLLGKL